MRKKLLILFTMGLLLAGCGNGRDIGAFDNGGDASTQQTTNSESAGTEEAGTESTEQQAYVFEFENAVTVAGDTMSSGVFANSKLTMVNVWATFCNPCISEMPDLGEIATAYDASEFQLIGIVADAMEGDEAMLEEAKAIIDETGANYPHLLLNEELYVNLVGASDSVPTTYFFNQSGELLGYLKGAQSKDAWTQIIDSLLEEID
ncbi:MAG: TlpA family protein disulfide reductase [Roseburia sp.]|nr:TlpA family protein disulfide reductase [Roseburia sp.]